MTDTIKRIKELPKGKRVELSDGKHLAFTPTGITTDDLHEMVERFEKAKALIRDDHDRANHGLANCRCEWCEEASND